MKRRLESLRDDAEGLSTVEYVIVLCLIAVVAIALWREFGQAIDYRQKEATNAIRAM